MGKVYDWENDRKIKFYLDSKKSSNLVSEFKIEIAIGRISASIQIKKQREERFQSTVPYLKFSWEWIILHNHNEPLYLPSGFCTKISQGKELQRMPVLISDGGQLNQKKADRIEEGFWILHYFITVTFLHTIKCRDLKLTFEWVLQKWLHPCTLTHNKI